MARERYTYCKQKYLLKKKYKKYLECLMNAIMRGKIPKKLKKQRLIFLIFLTKKHRWKVSLRWLRREVKKRLDKL